MTITNEQTFGPVRQGLEDDWAAKQAEDQKLLTETPPRAATIAAARQLADALDYEQAEWEHPSGVSFGPKGSRPRPKRQTGTHALFLKHLERLGL